MFQRDKCAASWVTAACRVNFKWIIFSWIIRMVSWRNHLEMNDMNTNITRNNKTDSHIKIKVPVYGLHKCQCQSDDIYSPCNPLFGTYTTQISKLFILDV